jgi:ribosomal protein S27E
MRITPDKMNKLDGKVCFICGRYLLNWSTKDLTYLRVYTGKREKARPDKYYLFACPNCNKIAHKRCWYDVGEKKIRKGFFRKPDWNLVCPSCGTSLAPVANARVDWESGYELPGHPDSEIYELICSDVLAWKAGLVFGKIGQAIDGVFQAVGLGSISNPERSAIAQAAQKVGKTIQDVAERVFRIKLAPEERSQLKELRCQNCGAPLPLPGDFDDAVVCSHCGTAHLL